MLKNDVPFQSCFWTEGGNESCIRQKGRHARETAGSVNLPADKRRAGPSGPGKYEKKKIIYPIKKRLLYLFNTIRTNCVRNVRVV